MCELSNQKCLYSIKAMYLGSEPMGELLDGQNGSDAIQIPLKKTIQRTDAHGDQVELTMTNESLIINFVNEKNKNIILPIDLLAYCGALRQVSGSNYNNNNNNNRMKERDFETLDKSPNNCSSDPPLFVTIFRHDDYETTLFCHSFVISKDDEAMEMVKLVMEIYYNLVRLQDMDDTIDNNNTQMTTPNSTSKLNNQINDSNRYTPSSDDNTTTATTTTTASSSSTSSLSEKNNQIVNNLNSNFESLTIRKANNENNNNEDELIVKKLSNNNYEIVSANDLINKTIDSYDNKNNNSTDNNNDNNKTCNELDLIENYSNVPINDDQSPIIIKKPNNEQIVYKQNVFIRWLQPPTPPPPAPIISKN
jgi:hypothetical protein